MDIGCLQDLYATRDADIALREFHAFVQVQVLYKAAEGPLTLAWCVTRVSVSGTRTLTRIGALCVCVCLLGVYIYIYKHVHVHIRWKCRNVQCKPSEFNLTSWDVRSVLVEPWRKKDLKLLSADLTSHYVSLPSQDAWRTWHQHAPGCLWRAYNIKVKKCIVNNYIYISKSHAFKMSFCASI